MGARGGDSRRLHGGRHRGLIGRAEHRGLKLRGLIVRWLELRRLERRNLELRRLFVVLRRRLGRRRLGRRGLGCRRKGQARRRPLRIAHPLGKVIQAAFDAAQRGIGAPAGLPPTADRPQTRFDCGDGRLESFVLGLALGQM